MSPDFRTISFSILMRRSDNEEIHKHIGPHKYYRYRAEFVRAAIRFALANPKVVTDWAKREPEMPWLDKENAR